jgi:hypothetical protein
MKDANCKFENMKNEFTVKVSVKPYVKKYLHNNCGCPVDITNLPALNEYFINLLSKPSHRRELSINNKFYSETVEILISEDTFNRYGCLLSKTDTVKFNARIESLVKFASRMFISNNLILGIPVARSIKEFQELFGFTDDEFQYETIKKDFDRHGRKMESKTLVVLKDEMKKIFLDNLSNIGTLSEKYLNNNEIY